RAMTRQWKAGSTYTESAGKALKVHGAEKTGPDLSTIQPDFNAKIVGTHVELGWGWQGFRAFLDMIVFQVDRNDGKGRRDLAYDTTPGYNDTEPFPAVPTKWTYWAAYRVGDAIVGQWSKPVSITVGG